MYTDPVTAYELHALMAHPVAAGELRLTIGRATDVDEHA